MNKWLEHVAKVRAKHKNKSYKECLQIASKTYKASSSKIQKGKGAGDTKEEAIVLASDDDDLDFLDFEDDDISTLPPKTIPSTSFINLKFQQPPKKFKYKASKDLGDLLFLMSLKRNKIDCWLQDPDTGNYQIKWNMTKQPLYRLTILGHHGEKGRTILKRLIYDCLKKSNGSFAALQVSLKRDGRGHRNYIIINLNTKEAFRYDPNGKTTAENYKADLLDNDLTGLFARIGFIYHGSTEVCPDIGLQRAAKTESDGEHSGLCQIWAGLFIDTFLHYPKLSVSQVEQMIKDKYDTPKKLFDFILSVADFLSQAKKTKYPGMNRSKYKKAIQKEYNLFLK